MGVEGVEHASDAALLGRVLAGALAVGEGGAGARHGEGPTGRGVVRIVHGVYGVSVVGWVGGG